MTYGNYSVQVLVDDRPVTTYYHNGQLYIEGRKGKNYKLKLSNHSSGRVEMLVSVDGLSITDGKAAGKASRGYILRPFESTVIDGWLVDQKTAAAFKFADKSSGYAAKSEEGEIQNSGVIGVMVFTEKTSVRNVWPPRDMMFFGSSDNIYNATNNMSDPGSWSGSASISSTVQASPTKGIAPNLRNRSASARRTKGIERMKGAERQTFGSSVGTEFGKAVKMETTITQFTRAYDHPQYQSMILYGSAKDLNKLGITMDWQKKPVEAPPNPFPADGTYGCRPPVNWNRD